MTALPGDTALTVNALLAELDRLRAQKRREQDAERALADARRMFEEGRS